MMRWVYCLFLSVVLAGFDCCADENPAADVVVYHASPGGLTTAIAAAREGLSVLIVTPYYRLGGIEANGGLVNSDQGPKPHETIGGLAEEFHQRAYQYYLDTYGEGSRQVERSIKGGYPGGRYEPKVAEMIYKQMLAEQPLVRPIVFGQELVAVEKVGDRIVSITCEDLKNPGKTVRYAGKMFVDASYTGDLFAKADVSFYLGREPKAMYNEPQAGIRTGPLAGQGDDALQTYNYRMTTTRVETNCVPIEKPDDYEKNVEDYYAACKSKFDKVRAGKTKFWHPEWAELPNVKFDTNVADYPGNSHGYPAADREGRKAIEQKQKNYSLGYLWFLQNDPRVPDAVRNQFAGLGLAKDEFPENGSFPVEIYVREGRRLIGEYVLTEHDLKKNRFKDDSICIGSYPMDSHACSWMKNADGSVRLDGDGHRIREGYMFGHIDPYEVPYRSIVPKKSECANLLVPVSASASHCAYASVRMEPIYKMMGEAAGVAASLALKSGLPVQAVDVKALRSKLKAYGAKPDLPEEATAADLSDCDFSWTPDVPMVGTTVAFSVSGDARGGRVLWDFDGDGKTDAEGAQVSHVFATEKNTLITLCVLSGGNVASLVEKTVSVQGAVAADVSVDSETRSLVKTRGGLSVTKAEGRGGPVYGENFLNDMGKNKGGVSVRYLLPLTAPGRYAVYISTDPAKGRPDNTLVRINTIDGEFNVRVDQRHADNPCGLVFAGEFLLPQENAWVEIRNDDTSRYCIFDTVRAVYLEK